MWLACALVVLIVPTVASSKPPAEQQYIIPSPSGTGAGPGASPNQGAGASGSETGGGGTSAVPLLIGGIGAIAIGASVIVYRKRRKLSEPG
jgi:LPXTG-motif cell wall-anchored protein